MELKKSNILIAKSKDNKYDITIKILNHNRQSYLRISEMLYIGSAFTYIWDSEIDAFIFKSNKSANEWSKQYSNIIDIQIY